MATVIPAPPRRVRKLRRRRLLRLRVAAQIGELSFIAIASFPSSAAASTSPSICSSATSPGLSDPFIAFAVSHRSLLTSPLSLSLSLARHSVVVVVAVPPPPRFVVVVAVSGHESSCPCYRWTQRSTLVRMGIPAVVLATRGRIPPSSPRSGKLWRARWLKPAGWLLTDGAGPVAFRLGTNPGLI